LTACISSATSAATSSKSTGTVFCAAICIGCVIMPESRAVGDRQALFRGPEAGLQAVEMRWDFRGAVTLTRGHGIYRIPALLWRLPFFACTANSAPEKNILFLSKLHYTRPTYWSKHNVCGFSQRRQTVPRRKR
jgi:hypothetical protein